MNTAVKVIQENSKVVNGTEDIARVATISSADENVGKLIAERASKAGVKDVVFDRGAYIYHGRVKALAEAAREGGLNF